MENNTNNNNKNEYYTIDLIHIMRTLMQRLWIIVLSGFLVAAIGFSISAFVITPKYSSSVMLYVNNKTISIGGNQNVNINSSDIDASQKLVKTYAEMLNNRTTLDMVIDRAGIKGKYDYKELSKMIEAKPANETEIMRVTVTSTDAEEARDIANNISAVLKERVIEITDGGSSMEVVDSAVADYQKVSPSITKYTAVGMLIGVLVAVAAIGISALMDDTIHNEDYILQNYDCPVLAKIPNLLRSGSKQYGYRYGYYYQSQSKNKSKE